MENKRNGGYTIIETMLSVAIFVIVITAGMSALISASSAHQKSQDVRSIMDGLSFTLEDMSRNLRTGYNYRCYFAVGGDISPGFENIPRSCDSGWGIAFEAANGVAANNGDQWIYYVNAGKLFKSTQGASSPSNYIQLTPDEVVVDSFSGFSVLGAEAPPTNRQQPFVTLRLSGRITTGTVVTPFLLQTSISQRLIDI